MMGALRDAVAGLTAQGMLRPMAGPFAPSMADRPLTEYESRMGVVQPAMVQPGDVAGLAFGSMLTAPGRATLGSQRGAVGEPFVYEGYHGTFAEDLPSTLQSKQYGGLHVGTKQAALDRLEYTRPGIRQGRPGGENLIPVKVTLKKPYGPVDETELWKILNFKGRLDELKTAGYDGIVYENITEDPGSPSVMVFDRASVEKR